MNRSELLNRKLQLKKKLYEDGARNRLALFLSYSMQSYDRQWFHTLIADKCQELYEGKIKKLMVFVPPQHGKSEIVSRRFPAWVLGKAPDTKIIVTGYSSTLTQQFSLEAKDIVTSSVYKNVFPRHG